MNLPSISEVLKAPIPEAADSATTSAGDIKLDFGPAMEEVDEPVVIPADADPLSPDVLINLAQNPYRLPPYLRPKRKQPQKPALSTSRAS